MLQLLIDITGLCFLSRPFFLKLVHLHLWCTLVATTGWYTCVSATCIVILFIHECNNLNELYVLFDIWWIHVRVLELKYNWLRVGRRYFFYNLRWRRFWSVFCTEHVMCGLLVCLKLIISIHQANTMMIRFVLTGLYWLRTREPAGFNFLSAPIIF